MSRSVVKVKPWSGLLLIAGLSFSMLVLVALSGVDVIPFPVGLLNILGSWLGVVLVILIAKTIFNRRR